ncbi:MAG: hypothetical protein IJ774_09690 [Selenomonadaceae bacterium]|nr:hypothetical protein [Selenomonadaceae bacterium]
MMRFRVVSLVRIFAFTMFIVTLMPLPTFAAMKSYTVENRTGRTIAEIYAVAADKDKLREFRLIKTPLEDGKSVAAEYDSDFRKYDLTVVFDDGEVAFWDSVNHKNAKRLVVYKDGKGYNVDTD